MAARLLALGRARGGLLTVLGGFAACDIERPSPVGSRTSRRPRLRCRTRGREEFQGFLATGCGSGGGARQRGFPYGLGDAHSRPIGFVLEEAPQAVPSRTVVIFMARRDGMIRTVKRMSLTPYNR